MRGARGVAITGTHGKTTTTSMLTVALRHAGADPSFVIGGHLVESGANAHSGSGEFFVAEADESDKSFLAYDPEVAIITNVEVDHLDFYGTRANYVAAFDDFTDNVTGALVVCADDPGARAAGKRARDRGLDVHAFGESAEADLRIGALRPTGTGISFDATWRGCELGSVTVRLPGRHNALNAAAAFLTGLVLGFPSDEMRNGLASYRGTGRRFELKGHVGGVRVYDEYSHHPSEVAAMVAAARSLAGDGRVVVVFQPHLFSRTRFFAAEFGQALGDADEVIVMDIYAARESPESGVTGALVADRVPLPRECVAFEPSPAAVPAHVADRVRPGDVVVTCGAGDVTLLGPEILRQLDRRTTPPPH